MQLDNLIVLDLETTGTNVNEDRIVQIAVMHIKNNVEIVIAKSTIINPTIPIPEQATKIHGITDEMVKDAPKFSQIAKALLELIKDHDVLGYNSITFDVPMLLAEFERCGLEWDTTKINLLDACNIYKIKEARTLSDAVRFYCDRDHDQAHDALIDARATFEVFRSQQEKYADISQMNASEIALFSNFGRKIVDLAGKFAYNEQNQIVFNFGKHKGILANRNKPYLEWMLTKGDFTADTKRIAKQILLS